MDVLICLKNKLQHNSLHPLFPELLMFKALCKEKGYTITLAASTPISVSMTQCQRAGQMRYFVCSTPHLRLLLLGQGEGGAQQER